MTPASQPGSQIERVLGVSPEQFLADHWPDKILHADRSVEALEDLASLEELRDIARFLEANPGRAWLHRTTADGAYDHETSVDAATAARLYEHGEMMDIRDVQAWIPAVKTWLSRFHTELGLEAFAHGGYCHAFVSPAGTGVPKHFDNREVIVVQIIGTKRWELAPNDALRAPLMPHVAGGPIHALNSQAGSRAALDELQMPEPVVQHTLSPGSAVFVPRGVWHRTHALEDSLSLSFGLRIPSWAELFVNTALQELAKDEAWRGTAVDLAQNRGPSADAIVETMRSVLAVLRSRPPEKP
jgi:50S ribosomal protein L16 3-hydroxylase